MKEKINIEKLFQVSLNQLDVKAPNNAWTNIEKRLDEKKKKRLIPAIWWRMGGIAAALVVGFFLGRTDLFEDTEKQNTVVIENSKSNTIDENKKIKENISNDLNSKSQINSSEDIIVSSESVDNNNKTKNSNNLAKQEYLKQKKGNSFKESDKNSSLNEANSNSVANTNSLNGIQNSNPIWQSISSESQIANNKTNNIFSTSIKLSDTFLEKSDKNQSLANGKSNYIQNNLALANQNNATIKKNIEINKKLDSTSVASVVPNALEELLDEKEKKSQENAEPKLNRWQVSTNVAPIYFSSLADGSPIDAKFESNQKSYSTSLSVGVGVQYALNNKLKIRTGINNLSLDYTTNDVRFSQSSSAKSLQNVNANLAGKLLDVQNVAEISKFPVLLDEGNELQVFSGSLNQRLGYLEVPMELSYNVINKKFGIEVLGGFSTLFLNQNEVNIVSSGLDMSIGEANNLNDIHFSGNLGLGVKYGFWKKLEARIEPVFKYQFNTFSNNDGNFKPYVFGVYSGFTYTF